MNRATKLILILIIIYVLYVVMCSKMPDQASAMKLGGASIWKNIKSVFGGSPDPPKSKLKPRIASAVFVGGSGDNSDWTKDESDVQPGAECENKESDCRANNVSNCLEQHYITLRKRLSNKDESIKDKTIIQYHYTDWCPYCIRMKKHWDKLKKSISSSKVSDDYKLMEQDQDVCNAPGIAKVPTIIKCYPDGTIDKYCGGEVYKDLKEWALTSQN